MFSKFLYRTKTIGLTVGLGVLAACGSARAQQAPKVLGTSDLYCSAIATTEAVPTDGYLISGENSAYKVGFAQGNVVYINRGSDNGVKVGDEFEVMRTIHDRVPHRWFKEQRALMAAMGTVYADMGHLRVVNVQAKTATAEVTLTCDSMQRGDLIRPAAARTAPTYHETTFDPLAPPSGKKTAMLVTNKSLGQVSGAGYLVLVNLGSAQGVQVGDYFRVFRYQHSEPGARELRGTSYKMYGFGSTPVAYEWNDLPRQVLGEGIVLRTGPNAATVLLTVSRQEIYDGDYVELE